MAPKPSDLPQIQTLLELSGIEALIGEYGRAAVVAALREELRGLREAILAQECPALPDFGSTGFAAQIDQRIDAGRQPNLRAVVNATGIVLHTNLGRATLAPAAVAAMQDSCAHATNLELDLATGKRGSRHDLVEGLICELTGAEAAVVVNNCAAAVLLALMSTAMGRNVIASRGELIEIGGAFRLPDVIAQSGATLKEVGTTNKTRLEDYENAIDDNTAVLLKSHTSNFRITGFTASADRAELARLAAARDVILMEDLGSGVLVDLAPWGLSDEPVVGDILRAGVDLVMFSGDKLLGGPQAGIIAGRRDIVQGLKRHPLMRAVRIGKAPLAALEATLRLYLPPHDPMTEVPILAMLSADVSHVERRAESLAEVLTRQGLEDVAVVPSQAQIGGGSLPGQILGSFALSVAVAGLSAMGLQDRLRKARYPVIGRIERERVLLDMRTVQDAELPHTVDALMGVTAG